MSLLSTIYSTSNICDPDVSIAIPTYRRPMLLKRAIDSIINQDFSNLKVEIIIVDNEQSRIYSEAVDLLVRAYSLPGLTLYRNTKNIGMYGNWEICIKLSRAKWLMILNDDDYLMPGYFSNISGYLSSNVAILGVKKIIQDERYPCHSLKATETIRKISEFLLSRLKPIKRIRLKDMYFSNCLGNSTGLLINRKSLESGSSLFNQEFYPSSDYEAWVRLLIKDGCLLLKRRLAVYVVSENESLKGSVTIGFVLKDREIRKRIMEIKSQSVAGGWILNLVEWNRAYANNEFWCSKINYDEFKLEPLDLMQKIFYRNTRIVRLILNIGFGLGIIREP